jgi:hypothetical protein
LKLIKKIDFRSFVQKGPFKGIPEHGAGRVDAPNEKLSSASDWHSQLNSMILEF